MAPTIDGKPILTQKNIVDILTELDIKRGDTVLVHSSLKSLGYVIGGAEAVINAIIDRVGEKGTIIMPTQTIEMSDPSTWLYPPVAPEFWDIIRKALLPYNKDTTPVSKGIGVIPETFRKFNGVIRTSHPLYSFAIWGELARYLNTQELDYGLGKHSPLGKLYLKNNNAKIVLIGTDFESNTSIHLAEHYLNRKTIIQSSYVLKNLKKSRVIFKNIPLDIYDDFLEFQRYFESKNEINRRKIYKGYLSVYNFRDVVEQAIEYYKLKDFIEGNNRSSQ